MNWLRYRHILWLSCLCLLPLAGCQPPSPSTPPALVLSAPATNDLARLFEASPQVRRVDTPAEAVNAVAPGGGVLVLADGYPYRPTRIDSAVYATARARQVRLFVEFPERVPGLAIGAARPAEWERGVIAGDAFGDSLGRHRIVMIHGARVQQAEADAPWIVMARVAGFDTAVYGLDGVEAWPVLFTHPQHDILVATTMLSPFISARYAPSEAWTAIWQAILDWAAPGQSLTLPAWEPAVRASFAAREPLPGDAAQRAVRRGAAWYANARMLVDSTWVHRFAMAENYPDRTGEGPTPAFAAGDGTLGVLEGFSSRIGWDGQQDVRWWRRADCASETAMTLAIAGLLEPEPDLATAAGHLQDFVYLHSPLQQESRADPESDDFGLVGWNVTYKQVHYGDDNARVALGTMATAAALGTDRWDADLVETVLANFRTTGPDGFRGNRLEGPDIRQNGWRSYFETPRRNYAPHYESWLWATYLWLYDKTGYEPLLERARTGIRLTMEAYPAAWRWTNGLQQERARMLLPLAWLVRVEDTPAHRDWLGRIADDLLAHQVASGAIQEELGSEGFGRYGPPASNDAYGTAEAPLIQENGDPVADMLYTSNFALLSLHEAAAATGDAGLAEARDRLVDFLIRIQVSAPNHPELDGAWFRAFDHQRWEYWASNADLGWGAWAVETGWTQSWITTVLALDQLETNLWDLTDASRVADSFDRIRAQMLPEG